MGKWLVDSYADPEGDCVREAKSAAHGKMRVVAETRRFGVGFAEERYVRKELQASGRPRQLTGRVLKSPGYGDSHVASLATGNIECPRHGNQTRISTCLGTIRCKAHGKRKACGQCCARNESRSTL